MMRSDPQLVHLFVGCIGLVEREGEPLRCVDTPGESRRIHRRNALVRHVRPDSCSVRPVRIRPTSFALLFGLEACRRGQPENIAGLADNAPAPPASAVSRFSVPLAFDFTAVLPTIERAVPPRFGSM